MPVLFPDSKQLSAQKRDKLFADVLANDWIGHIEDVISPEELSGKMLRRFGSLGTWCQTDFSIQSEIQSEPNLA